MRLCTALALFLLAAPAAAAQARWKSIGSTPAGNPVYVDTRTVKKSGHLVSADIRVVFTTPVKAGKVTWASSRTSATVDCARRSMAARENVYYSDARGTKVAERRVNKQPGFGSVIGGSLGDVALKHLCAAK